VLSKQQFIDPEFPAGCIQLDLTTASAGKDSTNNADSWDVVMQKETMTKECPINQSKVERWMLRSLSFRQFMFSQPKVKQFFEQTHTVKHSCFSENKQ